MLFIAADVDATGPRWGRAVAILATVVIVLVVREVILKLVGRSGGTDENGGPDRHRTSDEEDQ